MMEIIVYVDTNKFLADEQKLILLNGNKGLLATTIQLELCSRAYDYVRGILDCFLSGMMFAMD